VQAVLVGVSERPGLHLESILPISPPHALQQVAGERQRTRPPLPEDVAVLVQHEPGVFEEIGPASTQIDPVGPRRGNRAEVQAREKGVFVHPDLRDTLPKDLFETGSDPAGHGNLATPPHSPISMVYTIGHSNHPAERFVALLRQHGIDAVADVRSTPYSRFNPQFRRESLAATLKDSGIHYVFLGKELGARSEDPSCYEGNRVSYDKLARTDLFRSGLQRLLTGMREHRIALMCAEREPLECHRTILVARELERAGVPVTHILADGSLEAHTHALERLAASLEVPESDLFSDRAERFETAYELQAKKVAYVVQGPKPDRG
jgi:hypothetical protein